MFVSHASKDAELAQRICELLEARGIRCWIAPRDIVPGHDYGEEIIRGIEGTVATVLILSENANTSTFVKKEIERAVSKSKPVFPVRVREVMPGPGLELFVSSAHWIDAWQPPLEAKLDQLAQSIQPLLGPASSGEVERRPAVPPTKTWVWAAAVAGAGVLVVGGWFVGYGLSGGKHRAPGAGGVPVSAPVAAPVAPHATGVAAAPAPAAFPASPAPGKVASVRSAQPTSAVPFPDPGASRRDSTEPGTQTMLVILGNSTEFVRADRIAKMVPTMSSNVLADVAGSLLQGTSGVARIRAMTALAPRLPGELGGNDVRTILGNLIEFDRRAGVQTLVAAGKVKNGLTSNEAVAILNGTSGTARGQAIAAIAPNLAQGLNGPDTAAILGNLIEFDRRAGVRTLVAAGKVKNGLTSDEAVAVLNGTSGTARGQAIAAIAPNLAQGLNGPDTAAILGNLIEFDRRAGVRTLVAAGKVKNGLTSDEAVAVLNGTSGTARGQAIAAMASHLKDGLSGADTVAILGNLGEFDRRAGIQTLVAAGKVMNGLTPNEVVAILNGTSGTARGQAIAAIAPNLAQGLNGPDTAAILGNLHEFDRRAGTQTLVEAGKVRTGLTLDEVGAILSGTSGVARNQAIAILGTRMSAGGVKMLPQ